MEIGFRSQSDGATESRAGNSEWREPDDCRGATGGPPPDPLNDYSAGAVTVEQMMIEDRTGQTLEQVARAQVFAPLGMRRSRFASPASVGDANIAKAHDAAGTLKALPRGGRTFQRQGRQACGPVPMSLARSSVR